MDPFWIFHQLFFRFLTSSQLPKALMTIEHAPSSLMALPLQTPLPTLAMTVKKLQVSSKYWRQSFQHSPCQRPPTAPFSPPSFSATSGIDQFPTKIKEVDELTSNCL